MFQSLSHEGAQLSRRAMLGATTASFLGLSLQNLLARERSARHPSAEHVIFFWNGGGLSHIDTWDPKPGRSTQGAFRPIATSAPGVEISQIFPKLAQQMHHCALIRSIAGIHNDHGAATCHVQTGQTLASGQSHPGLGSVVVHDKALLSDLPGYVSIGGRAPSAGQLGPPCEAFFAGDPGEHDPYLAFPEGITGFRCDPQWEAFNLNSVEAATLDRYGESPFGRGALLAKRLVESGVRFVQVNRGGFDTHTANFPALEAHAEVIDPALASLVSDLAESGLLHKTLIVMLSEFGRSPRINQDEGRDHWVNVFSGFLAGGGIRGSTVVGASDRDGGEPWDRPVQVADVHATVYHALGIDFAASITPLSGTADRGEPVRELFS